YVNDKSCSLRAPASSRQRSRRREPVRWRRPCPGSDTWKLPWQSAPKGRWRRRSSVVAPSGSLTSRSGAIFLGLRQ
uniref:Uncharacterized protein n=1 Tax=Aegilops tauschii subsp. strangulata TaxID=200361 RepID=A0A452XDP8_AEGTS